MKSLGSFLPSFLSRYLSMPFSFVWSKSANDVDVSFGGCVVWTRLFKNATDYHSNGTFHPFVLDAAVLFCSLQMRVPLTSHVLTGFS